MSEDNLPAVDCTDLSGEEPIIQLTENGVEGYEILCRLCANRSDHLIPIYSEEGISNDLADKMNLYLPIKISKTDLLPLQCCFQCASTVLTWHELVVASVEADRRLREVQTEVEKQIAEQDVEPGPSQVEEDPIAIDGFTEGTDYLHDYFLYFTQLEHTEESIYLCEYCSYLSKDINIFFKHILEHKLECATENNNTADKNISPQSTDEISSHKKKKNFFECEICSRIFKRISNLNSHLTSHVKDLFCYVCCKSFINQLRLDEHMGFHSEEELLLRKEDPATVCCPYTNCTETFQSNLQLFEHKKHHENIIDYSCVKCPKKFRHLLQLERHIKKHEENIKCAICEKNFASKAVLLEHVRIHSDEKPLQCQICNMTFRYRSGYLNHQKTHSNFRKYKCGQCSKSFTRSNYLREHMRIHLNERPFKCKYCDMTFTQKNVLNTHLTRRHRQCPVCHELIGDILKVKMHLWKIHQETYDHFHIETETKKKRVSSKNM